MDGIERLIEDRRRVEEVGEALRVLEDVTRRVLLLLLPVGGHERRRAVEPAAGGDQPADELEVGLVGVVAPARLVVDVRRQQFGADALGRVAPRTVEAAVRTSRLRVSKSTNQRSITLNTGYAPKKVTSTNQNLTK